jgi:hypothetical protein
MTFYPQCRPANPNRSAFTNHTSDPLPASENAARGRSAASDGSLEIARSYLGTAVETPDQVEGTGPPLLHLAICA